MQGQAALATADRFVLSGRWPEALRQAERAAALLPKGSPGWKQAGDVIVMAQRALKRR